MSSKVPQSFANHRRMIPLFHVGVFGVFMLNLVWSVIRLVRGISFESVLALLMAVALILFFFFARMFALTAQDRVIRLEMRLRLAQLLPPDLQPRIAELTPGQLISLRFASDGELPELVRQVLSEGLTNRDQIKKRIKHWVADDLRV